jgi:hypothetical protein
MANEQRRPYEPKDPNQKDPNRGNEPYGGGTGQGRESERGPMKPGSGSDSERDRLERDRSKSGGTSDPNRGGSGNLNRSDDRE